MTFQELAEEYSECLRMCEPNDRKNEVARIAKEINGLNRNGISISDKEKSDLIDLIEKDSNGKPQRIAKAHDMTSFHEAIRLLRQQLSQ